MTVKVYTGKNLDDLLKSVAAEKGVAVEELTYTVKEEKAGFLGIGGKWKRRSTAAKISKRS